MKTNNLNAYTQALGALKLIPIYLNCPGVVSRSTLIGASTEAIQLLESMPVLSTELAEVFRCVNNVILEGQVAYVTPTNSPEFPFGAVVADAKGNICAAAMGKSKEGLAELIRLKLLPPFGGVQGERSVSHTLDQLRKQFTTPCPTLSAVREQYFAHIRTDRYLLAEIKAGRIALVVTRLHCSTRAKPVVYLHNLAEYLDAQATKVAA